ncbi:MAG: 4-hydroxybutyrate CoA-transferase [Chloroflexota bacterium]|nr:4-hydroxybutyrate CoA-transferase [Chloroflexota bacterium]
MTIIANRDTKALADEVAGEPIAYQRENPPYTNTQLPARHSAVTSQAEPTIQTVHVPAPATSQAPASADADTVARWPEQYRDKLTTAEEALKEVQSGQRVYLGGGCGQPLVLTRGLAARNGELQDVEIVQILTAGHADYAAPGMEESFHVNSLFIGHNIRSAVQAGRADFTPVFLHEIPRLFREDVLPLDVAIISVSPPDPRGYCSYGIEVGVTKPATESARIVIAEVNPQMPRVWGNSFTHLSQIDYCVPVDYALPELPQSSTTPLYSKIAGHVAELIHDGDTLQMGIGAIPDAVLGYLHDKRDLGVHSEMFSDGMIELVERGVITGARKTFMQGKIVAGFLLGTRRLYDFANDNPAIELHPVDFTNDPFIISRNDNMVAINSALQVDLTGQVCADSIGTRFYSGVGGQVDFMRGAARSKGGKPVIALPSTALDGTVSRIVSTLEVGAGVTTTRNDVHYVVTEYGVAQLWGKSARQRAEALIAIAHPHFRLELREAARARNIL